MAVFKLKPAFKDGAAHVCVTNTARTVTTTRSLRAGSFHATRTVRALLLTASTQDLLFLSTLKRLASLFLALTARDLRTFLSL